MLRNFMHAASNFNLLLLPSLALVIFGGIAEGLQLDECDGALGMETGEIGDGQISASSSFAPESVGPDSARIRTHRNGGAWCPSRQIDQDTLEYLQVNLLSVHVLTSVETQGRYGGGQGREYPTQYRLQYWRPGARDWIKYRNKRGEELLTGNTDTYTAVIRNLDPPIIASKLRFIPFSIYARTTCMRVELYGCAHQEGVISYNAPEGYHMGSLDLRDDTYDGYVDEEGAWMADGLGQLTDGKIADGDGLNVFVTDQDPTLSKSQTKAYPWVAWKNQTNGPWMEIIFGFDSLRNFTDCHIHAHLDEKESVLPPDIVKLWFSLDGKTFNKDNPVIHKVKKIKSASWIGVPIPNLVGKYVKLEVNLPGHWLMFSEVTFESRKLRSDVSTKLLHDISISNDSKDRIGTVNETSTRFSIDAFGDLPPEYVALIIGVMLGTVAVCCVIITIIVVRNRKHRKLSSPNFTKLNNQQNSPGNIVKGQTTPTDCAPLTSTLVMSRNGKHLTLLNHHKDKIEHSSVGHLPGVSPGLRRHMMPGIPPPIPPRQVTLAQTPDGNLYITEAKKSPSGQEFRRASHDHIRDHSTKRSITGSTPSPLHPTPGRTPNSCMSSLPSWDGFTFPPPPPAEANTDSSEYAEPTDLGHSAATLPLLLHHQTSPTSSRKSQGHGRGNQTVQLRHAKPRGAAAQEQQHVQQTCNSKPVPPPRTLPRKPAPSASSPPNRTPSSRSAASNGSNCALTSPESKSPRIRVAYRPPNMETVSSSTDAATTQSSLQTTEDDELHYASSDIMLRPGCRLSIQGVSGNTIYGNDIDQCSSGSSSCGELDNVVQFDRRDLKFVEKLGEGEFGEVHLCQLLVNDQSTLVAIKLLRRSASQAAKQDFERELHVLSRLQDRNLIRLVGACTEEEPWCMVEEYLAHGDLNQFLRANKRSIPYSAQIYMATQVASGMKYLETLGFVHRDLAARNCLIGDRFQLKIGDFGMARAIYAHDYYRVDGQCVLPVRWMACECIVLGKCTAKSDVWSFAVTLWEILDFAARRPFQELSDEQIIDNAQLMMECDPQAVYLDAPSGCPKEMYDLMVECWHSSDADRPSFREIHLFLQRKSLGFEPSSLPEISSLP